MKIIFTQLSEKYLQSAIDCLIASNTTEPISMALKDIPEDIDYQYSKEDVSDPRNFKTTTIAVDVSDENNSKVIGLVVGIDIVNFEDPRKHPRANKQLQDYLEFEWSMIEPLKQQFQQKNELIFGTDLCIRPEVQNQKIGTQLSYEFIQNIVKLGYKYEFALAFNQITLTGSLKFGWKSIQYINLQAVKIDGEYPFRHLTNGCEVLFADLKDVMKHINAALASPKL